MARDSLLESVVGATGAAVLGVVGSAAGAIAGFGPVKEWLQGCKARALAGRSTPGNHDLVKGIRMAHLCALDHVTRRHGGHIDSLPPDQIASDESAFAACARAFVDDRLKILHDRGIDHDVLTSEDIEHVLAELVHPRMMEGYAEAISAARAAAEVRALTEIERHADFKAPPLFLRAFSGRDANGWYDSFALFVAEELKTNERFRSIFLTAELADIRRAVAALDAQMSTALKRLPDLAQFMTDVRNRQAWIAREIDRIRKTTQRIDRTTTRTEVKIDRLQETVDTLVATLRENQDLSARLKAAKVDLQKVMAIARRTAENVRDIDQALKELEAHANIAIEVSQEGKDSDNLGDFVEAVLARARAQYDANDFDAAAREATMGFAEWEQRENARRADALQGGLRILEFGLRQDILRRDAPSAARRVDARADLKHGGDRKGRLAMLVENHDEWYERGRDRGVNFDLAVAIEIARLALRLTSRREPRGFWWNRLGTALATLGERVGGTAHLEDAVSAYRAGLEARRRDSAPLDWATTQNNLGNALSALGERERGAERFEEAVLAYRAALEEYRRDRVPLKWAGLQNNLGNALCALGERETGATRLEEAVSAFRAALEEFARDRAPYDWAGTQNNLGYALTRLGERTRDEARLEEAVSTFRAALEETRRESVPLDWAMTQHNLGDALLALGLRESAVSRLEESVAAYDAALTEYRRENVPLRWATSHGNQGVAMRHIADRRDDPAMATAALSQIERALSDMKQAQHVPLFEIFVAEANAARSLVEQLKGRA